MYTVSKELKKYSIILITMFIFLITLSPVHASSSDYVSYSRFKNATDHFIIDHTGKEYENSDILIFHILITTTAIQYRHHSMINIFDRKEKYTVIDYLEEPITITRILYAYKNISSITTTY